MKTNYDVAIIGGGPGGSTCGTLLKKYNPELSVAIFEKEVFPREHVGESHLPPISAVLDEMGVWEDVEAANFPIKVGATFRWGQTKDLWDFELIPMTEFKDEPRPAKYVGQRRKTAFQVERAIYDDILLKHAAKQGCEVFEGRSVKKVLSEDDRVTGLKLDDGTEIAAKHYIDASGNAAILRKAMGVAVTEPTSLQNVAFWDYWENTEWAVEIGVGGTRVQVLSLDYGWIWFIPLGPTRTSIGIVCPASYYKNCGLTPEQLYVKSIEAEPRVAALCKNGTREGQVRGTKDWSFLSERMHGENWMLVGETCGFADPILSAGLTLTQTGAREAAYTILEIERGNHDPKWMKEQYEETQRRRISQHIRFADFWYSANGVFTELKEYTSQIAADAGLNLDADGAWRWIASGGFSDDNPGQAGIGGLDLAGVKQVTQQFLGETSKWKLNDVNMLRMNFDGASRGFAPAYSDGKISPVLEYRRGAKRLALVGLAKLIADELKAETEVTVLIAKLNWHFSRLGGDMSLHHAVQVLETMLQDGWIEGRYSRGKPKINLATPKSGDMIHENRDPIKA